MKCPHCQKEFHPDKTTVELGWEGKTRHWRYLWFVHRLTCPACHLPIIFLEYKEDWGSTQFPGRQYLAFPKTTGRPEAPPEVPAIIAQDFNEACLVLADSPQASAALSRRCLQHVLSDTGVSESDNLSKAIDDALGSHLPSHISDNLDAIRNIGNFAAHPQKSECSGEIMPVEPQEAEWNLDVLEMLFDFYYVQPARSAARRDALNKKLEEAGKTPMKSGYAGSGNDDER